ncbi:PREDICTED: reticulon [Prunus dulcis]|uniref:Reticulon-like protein n=1 Tax=Prunus dulcis TaxID=3755 RepID=A0A5E4FZM7_PRUDU|nr:PREDICTED: reticulon [Prunus dulcis]
MPSDSTNDVVQSILLGRPIIIHRVLGGGKVADVLLWRNTSVSAALLIGMTVIWFIFGVVEYNWVILLYHLSITTLLIIFILQFVKIFLEVIFISAIIPSFRSNVRPNHDLTFEEFFSDIRKLFNYLDSAFGRDLPFFLLAIIFLYMLPVIGTYLSSLNLLYLDGVSSKEKNTAGDTELYGGGCAAECGAACGA